MRYVLLLLTILTAGFSVWYYQHHISPEGKELAAQKTTLEQEAAILEKAVIQSRKKLDDAQDATRAAENADNYEYFVETLPRVVPVANVWIAIGKGFFFGMLIALIACHFGLRVRPNTESLSAKTTTAVVTAITVVIVAACVLLLLFAWLRALPVRAAAGDAASLLFLRARQDFGRGCLIE